ASPHDVVDEPLPAGITVRRIGTKEVELFNSLAMEDDPLPELWPQVFGRLARSHARHLFVAEADGVAVARASLSVTAKTGWFRSMLVAPPFRGRGLQRALI